ncbi:MAG: LamG-like jellyroll fold domain-containing protein [Planctomycetota bacterium]|jgi:type II secretory pathway pseudopilin PulG
MLTLLPNPMDPVPRRAGRRALTLIELVTSLVIISILVVAMGSVMVLAARTIESEEGAASGELAAQAAAAQITRDLHFATWFKERSPTAVTFEVPDRNGDGYSEMISYAWSGVPGDPLVHTYNSSPAQALVEDVQSFDLSYIYRTIAGKVPDETGPAPLAVLLLINGTVESLPDDTYKISPQPTSGELDRQALLESWGYVVTQLVAAAPQSYYDAAVAGVDVVYVPETINSVDVGVKLRGAVAGVVNEEVALCAWQGFSLWPASPAPTDVVDIVDNTHEITAGFSTGALPIFNAAADVVALSGTLAGGLKVLGEFDAGGPAPGLAVIDTGGDLYDGGVAAARRVQLPWGRVGFDISALNDDGHTIMRRSIEWAAGVDLGGINSVIVARWALDDGAGVTAADTAGGHDGTLVGPTWVPGAIDGGLEFDGSSDYVQVLHDDALSLDQELTLAAWIETNSLTGYRLVFNKGTSGTNQNYWLGMSGDEITFGFHSGGYREFVTSGVDLATDSWYHVAATYDRASGGVRLYLEGAEVFSATAPVAPVPNSENLQIGRSQYGEHWNGRVDDLRIYNTVLSQAEIAALVAEGPAVLGYDERFDTTVSGVRNIQIATQATLTESGTVTDISAFVFTASQNARFAIYTDNAGEPGTLIVESGLGQTGGSEWLTLDIPDTALAPGTYWLALAFQHNNARYHQESGGAVRYRNNNAVGNGFLSSWGTPDDRFDINASIYATYIPDSR